MPTGGFSVLAAVRATEQRRRDAADSTKGGLPQATPRVAGPWCAR